MPPKKRLSQTQVIPVRSKKPRWDQLAATSTVPVTQFRGYADVALINPLLRPRSAASCRAQTAASTGRQGNTSSNQTSSAQKATDLLNDPDCINIRDHVEEPHKLDDCDNQFLMKLAAHLRIYSQDLACKGQYPEAKKAVSHRDFVLAECRSRRIPEPPNQAIADLEKIIQEYKEKWEKEMKEFDEETERELKVLSDRNEKELQDLEDDWSNNIVENYRKPSASLIRQRTLEAKMIQKDELDLAEFIHETVHQLEQTEAIQAQALFEKEYYETRQSTLTRQQQESTKYKFYRDNERALLLKNIKKDEEMMNNRLAVLRTKPKPLEPYKHPSNEVASRPSAVLDGSEELRPGRKLPMLTLPKNNGERPMAKRASASRKSNRDSYDRNHPLSQTLPACSNKLLTAENEKGGNETGSNRQSNAQSNASSSRSNASNETDKKKNCNSSDHEKSDHEKDQGEGQLENVANDMAGALVG